jgi:hypothetical protein
MRAISLLPAATAMVATDLVAPVGVAGPSGVSPGRETIAGILHPSLFPAPPERFARLVHGR